MSTLEAAPRGVSQKLVSGRRQHAVRPALARRAGESRHTRLVAHLDLLAAAASDTIARATIEALRTVAARHFPFNIYEECDCDPGHSEEEIDQNGVVDIAEIGPTCEDGFRYSICAECCAHDNGWEINQLEGCADDHDHGYDLPLCQTLVGIESALGLGPDIGTDGTPTPLTTHTEPTETGTP